ncbi:MAG: hypothetical protein IJV19_03110 [Prevotella sp.]|nr:hypothetical protein [Prevotella sp.]
MKKFFLLSLTLLVSVIAMADNNRSFKRGVCEDNLYYEEDVKALATGCSWYYSWGTEPIEDIAALCGVNKTIEFIPMAWGYNVNFDKLKKFYDANPDEKYLLGFNEPNLTALSGGSSISPTRAAEKWREIEQFAKERNLILVAPALNYSGESVEGVVYSTPDMWMDAWVAAYKEMWGENPSYDYLALHCYMNSASSMNGFVEAFAQKYGKPVWLTEFCSYENGGANVTEDAQMESMIAKLNYLERSKNVYRYAWFKGRDPNTKGPYYGLITMPNISKGIGIGHLSDVGFAYVHMSVYNTEKYYGIDEKVPANAFVDVSGLRRIEETSDPQATDRVALNTKGGITTMSYQFDVPADGTYKFVVRNSRDAASFDPDLQVLDADNNVLGSGVFADKGGDDMTGIDAVEVTLKAGKQILKLKKTTYVPVRITALKLVRSIDNSDPFNQTITGINQITTNNQQTNNVYNLAGQRVGNDYKGIVVKNGKRYIKK